MRRSIKPHLFASSIFRINPDATWVNLIPIGLILLLGVGLRFYQLTTESVWMDEILSIQDAQEFQLTLPYIRPFYFLLLKLWMQLGESDAWLRSLSVLFSLGTIYLTYCLGSRIVNESTGLLAALLQSVSPLFINHAQEIRMYALVTFLSVAGTLALTYVLENPTSSGLIAWTGTRTLLLLTNANNVLILIPDVLLLAWTFRKQRQWLVTSGIGLLVISLFFFPVFWSLTVGGETQEFMQKQVDDYSKPGIIQVIGMLTQFTVYWPLRSLLQSNQIEVSKSQLTDVHLLSQFFSFKTLSLLFYAGFTAILVGLLALALLNLFSRYSSQRLAWLACWAILPAVFTLWISYHKNSIWFPRYLLFIAPYFLILLAAGFVVIWNWRKPLAVGIAIAYSLAVAGGLFDYYTQLYRNDWQGAAQYVRLNQKPNDVIVSYSTPGFFELSFPRYYPEPHKVYLLNHPGSEAKVTPAYIEQELGSLLPIKSNLWLVCWRFCHETKAINRTFQTLAGKNFTIQQQKLFSSLEFTPIEVFKVAPNLTSNKGKQ